jgi:MFS superfamily sulfate permease-like transporter
MSHRSGTPGWRRSAVPLLQGIVPVERARIPVADVDYSAAETLRELQAEPRDRAVRLVLAKEGADVRDELDRQGITEGIGSDAFFETAEDVLGAYGSHTS